MSKGKPRIKSKEVIGKYRERTDLHHAYKVCYRIVIHLLLFQVLLDILSYYAVSHPEFSLPLVNVTLSISFALILGRDSLSFPFPPLPFLLLLFLLLNKSQAPSYSPLRHLQPPPPPASAIITLDGGLTGRKTLL